MKIDFINRLLQRKSVSVLIVSIAILIKLIQQIYFFVPTLDRVCQLVLAKNFLNGHGLSINKVLADGITETFIRVSSWPPGYPVIVGLISLIFHTSITNAAIIFDCISIALIIYFSRQILLTINCQLQWVNIYTLLLGFFLFDFSELPATDLNALAFYLWSIAITIRVIKERTINKWVLILLIAINIIPLSLKYLYAPLILIPPIYLLWVGIKMKNIQVKKIGLQFTIVTVLLCIALFAFQKIYTGNSTYLTESYTGFFPENLRYFFYIVISSFTNIVFDYSLLQHLHIIKFGQYYFVIWWSNVILCILLIYLFIKALRTNRFTQFSLKLHYTTLGSLACLVTISELLFLSIRYQIKTKTDPWTYIQEARYFAFVVIFLQQLYFMFLVDNKDVIKRYFIKYSRFILAVFFCIEILHGLYFTIKISSDPKNNFSPKTDDAIVMKTIKVKIHDLKKQYPQRQVYFLSSEDLFNYTASLEGATCFFKDYMPINNKTLSNSVILIVKEKTDSANNLSTSCKKISSLDKFDLLQCQ